MRKELSVYVLPFSSDSFSKEMFIVPGKYCCLIHINALLTLSTNCPLEYSGRGTNVLCN